MAHFSLFTGKNKNYFSKSQFLLLVLFVFIFLLMNMEYLLVDDNVHLERVTLSHAILIYESINHNRNYLRQWLPFVDQTRCIEDTERYIQTIISGPEKSKNEVYTIWSKGEFSGLAGFKDIDWINHKAEIGYWLAEKAQGKGIMTRTVKRMIDFGFRNMNFNRIQIKVAAGNYKSSAIPKRLDLFFEGVERNGEFHTDQYFDLEVYSILKSEWVKTLLSV
jgi:ribosomal-protein-serine acetyltransferase